LRSTLQIEDLEIGNLPAKGKCRRKSGGEYDPKFHHHFFC